jgi:hypothetical protein
MNNPLEVKLQAYCQHYNAALHNETEGMYIPSDAIAAYIHYSKAFTDLENDNELAYYFN